MKKKLILCGFSLIEILITLSIITIFIAISIPVYSQHIMQEHRLESEQILTQLAIAMEKYYVTNSTYQNATLSELKFPELIANNNYRLIILSTNDVGYVLATEPLGQQAERDSECGTLILKSTGEKAISGSGKIDECW